MLICTHHKVEFQKVLKRRETSARVLHAVDSADEAALGSHQSCRRSFCSGCFPIVCLGWWHQSFVEVLVRCDLESVEIDKYMNLYLYIYTHTVTGMFFVLCCKPLQSTMFFYVFRSFWGGPSQASPPSRKLHQAGEQDSKNSEGWVELFFGIWFESWLGRQDLINDAVQTLQTSDMRLKRERQLLVMGQICFHSFCRQGSTESFCFWPYMVAGCEVLCLAR